MSTDIKATIAELDRIDNLVVKLYATTNEIDRIESQKESDLKKIHAKFYPTLPKSPRVFGTLEQDPGIFQSDYTNRVKITGIGFVASLALFIIDNWILRLGLSGKSIDFLTIFTTVIFGICFFVSYGKYKEDINAYDTKLNRRNKYIELIKNGHLQDKAQFETDLADYYTQYQLYDHKFEECFYSYVELHNQLVEEGHALSEQIDAVTLLSQEHVVLAGRIRDMLQSSRADTLKEALNLAIAEKRDEEYKARQLAESARQTEVLRQQAYEERMHNERMEREAAAQTHQAQTQARIAEAQLKATEQQNAQLKQLLDNQKKDNKSSVS